MRMLCSPLKKNHGIFSNVKFAKITNDRGLSILKTTLRSVETKGLHLKNEKTKLNDKKNTDNIWCIKKLTCVFRVNSKFRTSEINVYFNLLLILTMLDGYHICCVQIRVFGK